MQRRAVGFRVGKAGRDCVGLQPADGGVDLFDQRAQFQELGEDSDLFEALSARPSALRCPIVKAQIERLLQFIGRAKEEGALAEPSVYALLTIPEDSLGRGARQMTMEFKSQAAP